MIGLRPGISANGECHSRIPRQRSRLTVSRMGSKKRGRRNLWQTIPTIKPHSNWEYNLCLISKTSLHQPRQLTRKCHFHLRSKQSWMYKQVIAKKYLLTRLIIRQVQALLLQTATLNIARKMFNDSHLRSHRCLTHSIISIGLKAFSTRHSQFRLVLGTPRTLSHMRK